MDNKNVSIHLIKLKKSIKKQKYADLNNFSMFYTHIIKRSIFAKVIKVIVIIFIVFVALPPFLWPVNGSITSRFLFRIKPDSKNFNIEVHHGIDIAASIGTKIAPTSIGKVKEVGNSAELGNYIVINHLFGFSSLYAHLNVVDIKENNIVIPGITILGTVGVTGRTTGPHLHFGLFLFNIACPPELLITFHTIRRKIIGI